MHVLSSECPIKRSTHKINNCVRDGTEDSQSSELRFVSYREKVEINMLLV